MNELFDVVAVSIRKGTVRFIDQNQTKANADAIVTMAVMRRGVDDEFFVACAAGKFKEGDKYEHESRKPMTEAEHNAFPKGRW